MNEKAKTKNIELSIENYEKLCGIKTIFAEIFDKSISFNEVIAVLTSPKLIDYSEILKTEIIKNVSKDEKPLGPEPIS